VLRDDRSVEITPKLLDLLLHLIRINEVEITDIPIAEITEQYTAYLDAMRELDLDVAGAPGEQLGDQRWLELLRRPHEIAPVVVDPGDPELAGDALARLPGAVRDRHQLDAGLERGKPVRARSDRRSLEPVVADLFHVLLRDDPGGSSGRSAVEGHEVGPGALQAEADAMRIDDFHGGDPVLQ